MIKNHVKKINCRIELVKKIKILSQIEMNIILKESF